MSALFRRAGVKLRRVDWRVGMGWDGLKAVCGVVMVWLIRLGTVRGQFLVLSLLLDGVGVGVVLGLAYWASLPIRWLTDPLFPRYFVSFFASWFGWVLSGCVVGGWVTFQVLATRWGLRFVNRRQPRWLDWVTLSASGCLCLVVVVVFLMGDVVKALFFLVGVGILLSGCWPAYVVVRRWERAHRETLLPARWFFRTRAARRGVGDQPR